MAKPTTYSWTKLSIWVGDGASPEDFTSKACGLTATRFGITGSAREFNIPDCATPDDPIWTDRTIQALSAGVSGSGLMSNETFTDWAQWMLASTAKNCRIVVEKSPTQYFSGSFLLTSFELNGDEGEGKVSVSVELSSNGKITKTVGEP